MKSKIVEKIKLNKKYSGICDEVVLQEIENCLKKNKDFSEEELIKEVRRRLHLSYASFQTRGKKKIKKYFELLKKGEDVADDLLSVNLSTKERLENYDEIYFWIFSLIKKPKIIVDLGGGFNVFSFPYMRLKNVKYFTYDINEDDVELLNKYYELMVNKGLIGNASILDIRDFDKIRKLLKCDVIFLFKVLDVLDVDGHKTSEELIVKLFKKTKFVVVSFAIRTLTRKRMNYPNRKWFELVCVRRNWKFEKKEFGNEIFYVVKN